MPTASATYFSAYDSVNFAVDPLLVHVDPASSAIEAKASVLLGLLVGDSAPCFTDAQLFDNRCLLDELCENDENSDAILELAANARLRYRILDPGPGPDHDLGGLKQGLLTAFVEALYREDFVFSAWPELEDLSLRAEVAAVLVAGVSLDAEFETPLRRRLTALKVLDDALRGQTVEVVDRPTISPALKDWLGRSSDDPELSDPARMLHGLVNAVEKSRVSLERRSVWHRVIRTHSAELGVENSRLFAEGVDAIYNDAIATQFQCGATISLGPSLSERLGSDLGIRGLRNSTQIDIAKNPGIQDHLSWSQVPELLRILEHYRDPQARLDRVIAEMSRAIGQTDATHGLSVWIRVAAPSIGGSAAVAGVTAAVVDKMQVLPIPAPAAIGASALTVGVLTAIAASPPVNRFVGRRIEQKTAEHVKRVRAELTRGGASWIHALQPEPG